jgi:hypothetical protein
MSVENILHQVLNPVRDDMSVTADDGRTAYCIIPNPDKPEPNGLESRNQTAWKAGTKRLGKPESNGLESRNQTAWKAGTKRLGKPDFHNRGSTTRGSFRPPSSARRAGQMSCPSGRSMSLLFRGSSTRGYENQALRAIRSRNFCQKLHEFYL